MSHKDDQPASPSADSEPLLDQALAEILERMHEGQAISLDAYCRRYPSIEQPLRQLFPSMTALAELSSASNDVTEGHAKTDKVHPTIKSLGDFRLIGEIGRGGMGVVYEAEQLSLARRVALKVLPFAALLDERQLERFKNEARAAAMLTHPNIVSVYSVGCERAVHFYAMELVHGQSMSDLISEICRDANRSREAPQVRSVVPPETVSLDGTHPVGELSTQHSKDRRLFCRSAARLGIEAADALQYAHEEGVIHRDIKPSNLLVDQAGHLHIADFGLARIQSSDALTMTGDVVGTLRYMSPEQLDAGRFVDHRSDVYSLGVTLYELLCGSPAIDGKNRKEIIRHIDGDPPRRLRSRDAQIPSDLETIVHKCLEKSPAERYQTAKEVADDLRRFCSDRPIRARRTPLWQLSWRWARRNRLLAAVTSMALVTLLMLAIGGPIVALHLAKLTLAQRTLSNQLGTRASQLESQLYDSRIRQASTAIERGDYRRARHLLAPYRNSDVRAREFELDYLGHLTDHADEHVIAEDGVDIAAVAISPGGKHLAYATWDGTVVVLDRETHLETRRLRLNENGQAIVMALQFSKDGRFLFFGGETFACLLDTERDEITRRWTEDGIITAAAYKHADDDQLAIGLSASAFLNRSPSRVIIYQLDLLERESTTDGESPERNKVLTGIHGSITDVAFSVDGRSLVVASQDGLVHRWDTGSFERLQPLTVRNRVADQLAFHPTDPNLLAVSTWDAASLDTGSTVALRDLQEPDATQTICGHRSRTSTLEFSLDGNLLATGHGDGMLCLWDVSVGKPGVLDGCRVTRHQQHASRIQGLAFSPDGEWVYTASADGLLKRQSTGESHDRLQNGASAFIGRLEFFQDDRRLACAGYGKPCLALWDIADQTLLKQQSTGSVHITGLTVLPSQQQVAYVGYAWHGGGDAEFGLWDIVTGQRTTLWQGMGPSSHVALSANQNFVLAASGDTLLAFDLAAGQLREPQSLGDTKHITALAAHPKKDVIAISFTREHDTVVEIRGVTERATLDQMEITDHHVTVLVFSPDGTQLACATQYGPIVIREDIISGERREQKILEGHKGIVWDLEFSPTGKRLVSAGLDGTVRIWNGVTGTELLQFQGSGVWNYAASFSRDGRTLAFGGGRGTAIAEIHLLRAGR